MIILSYTFHPYATHNYMQTHSLLFRLFANVFFSILIGMGWAFLSSYCLKETQRSLANSGSVLFGTLSTIPPVSNS